MGSTDFTSTTLDISGTVGYFASDLFELSGVLLLSYQSVDFPGSFGGSQSGTAAGLVGGVALNLASSSNVVPFVRGSVGFLSNSGDLSLDAQTTVIAPLLEGGLRVRVGKTGAVNFVVGHQLQSNALGVHDESADIFTLGVGVSVFPVLKK